MKRRYNSDSHQMTILGSGWYKKNKKRNLMGGVME